jgi:hypothetical protein
VRKISPMPDDRGRLFVTDIAEQLKIAESDWRARVSRGHAPQPDDVAIDRGAARPVWEPRTISEWRERPGRRGPLPAGAAPEGGEPHA